MIRELRTVARKGRVRVTAIAAREPVVELWDVRRKTRLFEKAFDAALSVRWKAEERTGGMRVIRGGRGARSA